VTRNFLIETYSFFEKQNPTTTLLIKSIIYKYFGAESKRKAPFYAWNKAIDRTVQALDISHSFLNKILKKEPVEPNEKSVNKCKDSLDSFDKDLIRRVVVGFFFEK
jgi:hypothetical protein